MTFVKASKLGQNMISSKDVRRGQLLFITMTLASALHLHRISLLPFSHEHLQPYICRPLISFSSNVPYGFRSINDVWSRVASELRCSDAFGLLYVVDYPDIPYWICTR